MSEIIANIINSSPVIVANITEAGPTGLSAWEYAKSQGYAGTEAEFAIAQASLPLDATHAAASALAASVSETNALSAKGAAQTAQTAAESAQTGAISAKDAAVIAETASETAKGLAEAANISAQGAKTAAQSAQGLAETARDTTQGYASSAQTSATTATNAKNDAQTAKTAAELAETHAKTSETNSKTSETNSKTSETNAGLSALGASGSATDANNAKLAAQTAQTNAELAETHAETAETNAVSAKNSAISAQGLAEGARDTAVTAKDNAILAKTAAQTAQGLAETAKTGADTAKSGADTAKTGAETAKSGAESARDTAITAKDDAITAKNASQTAQGLAETAKSGADTAKAGADTSASTATTKATLSQSYAVGGTGTRSGEDTDNAKYYKEQAGAIVGGDYPTKSEAQGYVTTHDSSGTAHSTLFGTKVDKITGKGLSTEDYTSTEKTKLSGIEASANNYTHPANHAISVITGLQTALDGKVDDGQVLTNVPTGALFTDTIYVHPATSGNKHIPSGGAANQVLKYSADGTAVWGTDADTVTTVNGKTGAIAKADVVALGIPAQDTTYSVATQSVAGLESAADKTKLDGIATGAEVNVNADWNASSGDAQILNKPTAMTPSSHAHGNITNDGKIGSTADLPVFTTTAGALATKTIADAKTLLGITASVAPLYEKIRNITDTSATTTLSIDISDIDWAAWQEIRLIFDVGLSAVSSILVRINNSSAANYDYSVFAAGAASLAAASGATSLLGTNVSAESITTYPAHFDIDIRKQVVSPSYYVEFLINDASQRGSSRIGRGRYSADITDLTSLNLVSNVAGRTVTIANASLWGIRK